MSQEKIKRIHIVFSAILGLLVLTVGVCFIIGCLNIYNSGESAPFSRESIGEQFSHFAIPTYLCLAFAVGGIILNLALPLERKKSKVTDNDAAIIARLEKKADLNGATDIQKLRTQRKLLIYVCIAVYAVWAIFSFVFLFLISPNNDIVVDAAVILGSLALPFALSIAVSFINKSSLKKELSLVRAALASSPSEKSDKKPETHNGARLFFEKNSKKLAVYAKLSVFIVAVAFIIVGIVCGGAEALVLNAIKLCKSCIGVG